MRSTRLTAISLFTAIILLNSPAGHTQSWGSDQGAQVKVEQLTFERERTRVDSVGTAQAIRSVSIYPAVADEMTQVNFSAGDKVEAGAILVKLDARRQEIAVARATLELMDAERTLDRLKQSRENGAVPQSDVDEAEIARDLIEVQLDEAETNLEDRMIRAPFAGVVGITDVEVGDRVTTTTMITTLDKRDQLLVDFRAPEAAAELLQSKAQLSVQPWQNRSAEIPAKVVNVDSRIDSASRTLRAQAVIDNQDDLYRPGMSFRVRLQIQGDSYAVIPESALSWGADSAYVWIADDKEAKRVEVQIKQRLEGRILVAGELSLGDVLITEGIQSLRNGQSVIFNDEQVGGE
ncbi:MAG: efflux RND transporter periplasmic adaptor subunit [Idiomarina sp.]